MEPFSPIRVSWGELSRIGIFYFLMLAFVPVYCVSIFSWFLPEARVLLQPAFLMLFVAMGRLWCSAALQVWLEPEQVRITLFGCTLRRFPISRARLLCIVGDWNEDLFCFSAYSVEELAFRREAQLRKSLFGRRRVAARKAAPNWQKAFANEYLRRTATRTWWLPRDKGLLWFPADHLAAPVVPFCYPHLPLQNWQKPPDYDGHPAYLTGACSLQPDGIWLEKPGNRALHIPKGEVRTVLRLDCFAVRKFHCHHQLYYAASRLTLAEIAVRCKKLPPGMEQLPFAPQLRAASYVLNRCIWWSARNTDFCVMYGVPDRSKDLRVYYPRAQWIDLSPLWAQRTALQ